METKEPNPGAELQDIANRAGIPVAELEKKIADAEKAAREKLRVDSGGLSWFGLPPAAERGKGARPAATYRGARRNAARDAHWP